MSRVHTPQKRKGARFTSEAEILELIDRRQAAIRAWCVAADELDAKANHLIKQGVCGYDLSHREAASKLRKRAVGAQAGLLELKALLAEFRTQVLPGMGCDGSVQLP